MTAEPASAPVARDVCPLCGAPVHRTDTRCPECNMTLAGVGERPAAFNRRSLWVWAAGLLIVYLVALVVVALAR